MLLNIIAAAVNVVVTVAVVTAVVKYGVDLVIGDGRAAVVIVAVVTCCC